MSSAPDPVPTLREQVFRVGPHAGSHRVAARAALTVAVPLLVLWAAGRMEWSIYAAFGAFTSLYGRNDVHVPRLLMQARVGAMLVTAVLAGVAVGTSPDRGWLAIPLAALVAAIGSWTSDVQGWHPPGPLFLVFAFAACASIPTTPADLVPAFAVSAATAVFAVLVGAAGSWWRAAVARRDGRARAPADSLPSTRAPAAVAWRRVLRCALSCLVAGSLATGLGIGHPYWAMVSAVVPLMGVDITQQVVRGVHRVVGTLVGLVLAGGLLAVDLPVLALIAVVVALQAGAELWVGRNYAIALVFVTPLALLMVHLVAPVPPSVLIVDRGVETVIGVAVGLVLGWLTRPRTR